MSPGGNIRPGFQEGGRFAFVALCGLVVLASFCLPLTNADIFWHLSAAREMFATGRIPRVDWLSFTMAGRPWVDFEWLCQIIWYGVFHFSGMWGLLVLKFLILTASAICLWSVLEIYELSMESQAFAVLAYAIALSPSNDLRPENFSLLFFLLEFWFLESSRIHPHPALSRKAGEGKTDSPLSLGGRVGVRGIWIIPALFAVWANIHAGFVYGVILLAIYAGTELMRHRSTELLKILIASLAATLINPFGFHLYAILFEHYKTLGDLAQFIREWREPDFQSVWLMPFWILWIGAFTAVLVRYYRRRDVPAEHILALCLFAISAGRYVRTTMYFTAVAVPISAGHLSGMARGKWKYLRLAANAFAAAALLMFFTVNIAPNLASGQPFLMTYVPGRMVHFLETERAILGNRKIFNPWEWGGYLGYKLHPDYSVFVDGRYLFHPFLKQMADAQKSPEAYQELLNHFGVDVVVVRRFGAMFQMPVDLPKRKSIEISRPWYLFYLPKAQWAMVYWGADAIVFVRRSAAPAKWLKAREFKIFRPEDQLAVELLVREGFATQKEVAQEGERFIELSGASPESAREVRSWIRELK